MTDAKVTDLQQKVPVRFLFTEPGFDRPGLDRKTLNIPTLNVFMENQNVFGFKLLIRT